MISFFHTVLYLPIYNLLIFLVGVLPGGDVGLAVVVATIIVKLIILPLSMAALRTQRAVKAIEPELKAIREKYKDDREAQAKETFALYKKYGVNPFAGLLTLIIQLPIIIVLYWVFATANLPAIDASLLYSFVSVPDVASPLFLGLVLVTGSSLLLAILAGVTQFIQAIYAIPMPAKSEKPSMSADMGRAMALQMRYVLPVIMAFFAYTHAGIALYFITTNLFGIIQEFFIRREKLPVSAS